MGFLDPQESQAGQGWLAQAFSQSDRVKRFLKDAIKDPVGFLGRTAGQLQDNRREFNRLSDRAMAGDKVAAGDIGEKALGWLMGFAPVGMIAYHGSPHKFTKFDSSKIGTGEGAQAYGHGLYLAESPDVARQYADALGTHKTTIGGKPVTPDMPDFAAIMEVAARGHGKALSDAKAALASGFVDPVAQSAHIASLERIAPLAKSIKQVQEKSLYKVDLPDSAVARMLDWDKPLSQQAPEVQQGLRRYMGPKWDQAWSNLQGVNAYDVIAGGRHGNPAGSAEAAKRLREAGIPGIRYLDGGSRGAGQGSSNFVIFPGEENLLTILERNGVPVR